MDTPAPPPQIFAPERRRAARARSAALQQRAGAARFLHEEAAADVLDRLAFLRLAPGNALVIGDVAGRLAGDLRLSGIEVTEAGEHWNDEAPFPTTGYDLIVSLFRLDAVNDLPGSLVHLRHALNPGGLMLATMAGAGSLPVLRAAMLAADGDRPAPRLHPQVDVKAAGQLLQRAGFSDPITDTCGLGVRYSTLGALAADLRAMALANQLARPGPPLTRAAVSRAKATFAAHADADGRVTERFEILTLSGRRP